MQYGKLGNTGLIVSKLGFGAGSLGTGETLPGLVKNIDLHAAEGIVGKALDAGVTMFDTSNKYVSGQSEELLGKALGRRRSEAVVATKCGLPVGPGTLDRGLSARHVIQQCEISLKRMGTDWIDVYYAHQVDPETPLEETARAFEHLVISGKVRYVAVSNWPAWMTARMQGIGDRMDYAPIVANQVYYSLLGRQVERELVPLAKSSGMGLIVYSALAGGFLSGKYERDKAAPPGTRRATFNIAPKFEIEHGHDVVDLLRVIAAEYGVAPAHVALAWTMQRPTVASVLFGISRASQLDENLPAADLVLAAEHVAALDAITESAE